MAECGEGAEWEQTKNRRNIKCPEYKVASLVLLLVARSWPSKSYSYSASIPLTGLSIWDVSSVAGRVPVPRERNQGRGGALRKK